MANSTKTTKETAKNADKLTETATKKDQAELKEDELKQVQGGSLNFTHKGE